LSDVVEIGAEMLLGGKEGIVAPGNQRRYFCLRRTTQNNKIAEYIKIQLL